MVARGLIQAGRILAVVLLSLTPTALIHADEPTLDPAEVAFFESKVRPILVERCYACHSAEAKSIRGNLLLDTKAGWQAGGDIGPAIEPGDPDASLLIEAVRYDELLRMPPDGKLPESEITALVEWVKMGAPDPRVDPPGEPGSDLADTTRAIDFESARNHWAFQPLRQAEPPTVSDPEGWCRTPIDQFILAGLQAEGLHPSDPAGPVTLLRRATFDLTGLPPTPEQVASLTDTLDAEAYGRLVDELLASPHYGERWARHWLDLARYAESHGFEHDYDRPTAYHYRDFVVEALNRDIPYNEFVRWQLAGDEIAPEDPLAVRATGFLAAGVHSTQITASQAEKERYDELDDMINTTGTAFLGLAIGCARCHDHKFDPIPQADYYNLISTFTTTVRSEVDLDLDPEGYAEARAAFDAEHTPYLEALTRFEREELPGRFSAWEVEHSRTVGESDAFPWLILDLVEATSQGGATFTRQPDGSLLAGGPSPDHDAYVLKARTDRGGIRSIRLEALADASLAQNGPGRASNGNFALTDFTVTAQPLDGSGEPVQVPLVKPRATFEQPGLPVAAAIDADGTSGWAVDPQFGRDHAAGFEAAKPFGFEGGTEITVTLRFANNLKHSIGRPRLAITSTPGDVALDAASIPQLVVAALAVPQDARTPEQTASLLSWFKQIDPGYQELLRAEQQHAARAPTRQIVKALISTEGLPAVRLHTQGPDFYETTYHLRRGDPSQKAGAAEPGFLQVLVGHPDGQDHWMRSPPEGWRTSYRRTALADWITDTEHGAGHLLARVIVNRLWQHHFGRGLVATPSDFGMQGEPPTHPELLDWLAGELIRGGWYLKPIHRLIMASAVYQQASRVVPDKAAVDIENRLLWRQNRRRLEAEAIRDAMLATAGMLDDQLYGPGTLDESMRRRSLYFAIKRSQLIPMMTLFDAPDALVPIANRSTTTVAPQSLFLLNNPQVRLWAEGVARRVAPCVEGSPEDAIRATYRLALSREPEDVELHEALGFFDHQTRLHEGRPDAKLVALTDFCQVVFGLNEFVFID